MSAWGFLIISLALAAVGLKALGDGQDKDAPAPLKESIPTSPAKIPTEQIPTPPAKVIKEKIPTLPAKLVKEKIPTLPAKLTPLDAIPTPPLKGKKLPGNREP